MENALQERMGKSMCTLIGTLAASGIASLLLWNPRLPSYDSVRKFERLVDEEYIAVDDFLKKGDVQYSDILIISPAAPHHTSDLLFAYGRFLSGYKIDNMRIAYRENKNGSCYFERRTLARTDPLRPCTEDEVRTYTEMLRAAEAKVRPIESESFPAPRGKDEDRD